MLKNDFDSIHDALFNAELMLKGWTEYEQHQRPFIIDNWKILLTLKENGKYLVEVQGFQKELMIFRTIEPPPPYKF